MSTFSYWDNRGRYQAAADTLGKLIPASGPLPFAHSYQWELDRYRRAVNCYYDLFNNGLCNRGAEFRALFRVGGLPRKWASYGMTLDYDAIERDGKVDARMDTFVLRAAQEQGILVES